MAQVRLNEEYMRGLVDALQMNPRDPGMWAGAPAYNHGYEDGQVATQVIRTAVLEDVRTVMDVSGAATTRPLIESKEGGGSE